MFEESVEVMSPMERFYYNPLYLSYSATKLLLQDPRQYKKKYIDLEYEEKIEKHMIEGRVVHCLLLNNHRFNELFIVSELSVPTGNNKKIVDMCFRFLKEQVAIEYHDKAVLVQFRENILEYLRSIDLHQKLVDDKNGGKTGDDKRMEKILTEENISYFNFLKKRGSKDVIDTETLEECRKAASIIRDHPEITYLMGMNPDPYYKAVNEIEMKAGIRDRPFGIKGVLDNVVVDDLEKEIRINDVKKTSRPLSDFSDNVETYMYWLQASIYYLLVYQNLLGLVSQGYNIVFNFIVIDSTLQVYAFRVSPGTMRKWIIRTKEVLDKVEYHYENKYYNLPYSFEIGEVCL